MKKYGRRIKNGNNGNIIWCELSEKELAEALTENVSLNSAIYQQCFEEALTRMNITKPEDKAAFSMNPGLRREVSELANALFQQCAINSYMALQEALDEKVHWHKANHMF